MKRDTMTDLLGKAVLPGSRRDLDLLATRIEELVRLNGEAWVRGHQRDLLEQWRVALSRDIGEKRK